MKRIITYGTFDLLHKGHTNLFEIMRSIVGPEGEVFVAISTDEFNELKSKRAHQDQEIRKAEVHDHPCVDHVITEYCWEQKREDIISGGFDFFIMGNDWSGTFDDLPCTVLYTPRTMGISSTQLRGGLKK
jgi:glycerol-3-phosphate cytidylyltransferase